MSNIGTMKLTALIQKAINKASVLHVGQKRKQAGLPYIVHPFSVAFILAGYTDDEEIIAAGLLHDALEDVPGYGYTDMEREFGHRIAGIVKEVSEDKDPSESKEVEKATWAERKGKYLAHLKRASREAMMVCAADKIHNLTSLIDGYRDGGEKFLNRFNAPLEKKLQYYGAVLEVLKERLYNEIVRELGEKYAEACKVLGRVSLEINQDEMPSSPQ